VHGGTVILLDSTGLYYLYTIYIPSIPLTLPLIAEFFEWDDLTVFCSKPPTCVMFRPDNPRHLGVEGLDQEIFPIFPIERSIQINGSTLSLKVGCIAGIMRNLSIEDGLVKDARVQVRLLQQGAIGRRAPDAGPADMPTFFLPRISFEFQPLGANWTVQRRQFPLRLVCEAGNSQTKYVQDGPELWEAAARWISTTTHSNNSQTNVTL
jgi:hypothetical protein